MITDKETVFILGAGASIPYGFPIGEGLKNFICKNYANIIRSLKRDVDRNQLDEFINLFKNSGETSIDNFLARYENQKEFKHIINHGKMAIFLSIIHYERNSPLYKNFLEIKDDWYGWIYRQIRPFDDINQLPTNKVSFITFNYDRSLEYYLLKCLNSSFAFVDKSVIREKFNSIPIIHVYGKLGSLEETDSDSVPFGSECNYLELLKFKDNVKTMHERNETRNEKIDELLQNAEKIFIIGFGFDKANVRFLKLHDYLKMKVFETYISNYDNSEDKMEMILKEVGFKGWQFNICKGSCLTVLEENFSRNYGE